MYTYSDIKNYIKFAGWVHFLALPLRRIQSKFVFERGHLYFFFASKIAERQSDPSIIIKEASIDDLNNLKGINPNTPRFREFIKKNEILIIALNNEEIIGHVCFVRDVPKRFKGFINLRHDELWFSEVYILPEYRNKGIYSMLFSFAAFQAKKQGITKIFGDILSNNQKSIEINTKKFGFNRLAHYQHIKILFYEHTWIEENP